MNSYRQFTKNIEKQKKQQQVVDQLSTEIHILEKRRDQYAEEAKKFLKKGNKPMATAQISLMKYVIFNIQMVESMLANYTIAKEMSDIQSISKAFTKSLNPVLRDVVKVANSIDAFKTENLFNKALTKSKETSLQLRDCLKNNNFNFVDSVNDMSDISDDEIMQVLGMDVQMEEDQLDSDLDSLEKEFVSNKEPQKVSVGPEVQRVVTVETAPAMPEPPVPPAPTPEPEPVEEPKEVEPEEEPCDNSADPNNEFEYHGKDYNFPSLDLLKTYANQEDIRKSNEEDIVKIADLIVAKLKKFDIEIELSGYVIGAAYSRLEYKLISNTALSAIAKHNDDVSMAIGRKIRMLLPIIGKDLIGIEVENAKREILDLKSMLSDDRYSGDKPKIGIGYTIDGEPVFKSFDSLPHLLVGGATGSGKSVFLSSVITSILFKYNPRDVRLILIDFKRVEMNIYNGVPHLVTGESIDEFENAQEMLTKLCDEMERRYQLFHDTRCRSIAEFNEKLPEGKKLPIIVTIIDEYADMVTNKGYKEVSVLIQRIAQKARAAGIHLIIATQRPSVKVIDGVIKANLPSRIAFTVASHVDSMNILDQSGAEDLIGCGDMMFENGPATTRLQAPFISTDEIINITDSIIKENA